MTTAHYRLESDHTIYFRLLPVATDTLFVDRMLAIAMAAKSATRPPGQEIRVVHVPSGEVVFRKPAATPLISEDV